MPAWLASTTDRDANENLIVVALVCTTQWRVYSLCRVACVLYSCLVWSSLVWMDGWDGRYHTSPDLAYHPHHSPHSHHLCGSLNSNWVSLLFVVAAVVTIILMTL